MTAEDWARMYEANVLSAQRLVGQFLPGMKRREYGRIINLGTAGVVAPGSRNPHYYAAKAALVALTASLAREVAGTSVARQPGLTGHDPDAGGQSGLHATRRARGLG